VVAILGAHSLGNAEIRNTGHTGSWTPSEEDVFNVTYYENMATRKLRWINKVRNNLKKFRSQSFYAHNTGVVVG
jgi:hypothetical protein